MSYISSMMEASAVVLRPAIGFDRRHGVKQNPFVPVDPVNGGVEANRVETELPCSVQQAGPRDIMLYGQRNAEFSTVIIFAQDPRCQINDQMRVKDRTGNTTYYLVVGAAIPVGRARQWIVTANYVQQPQFP